MKKIGLILLAIGIGLTIPISMVVFFAFFGLCQIHFEMFQVVILAIISIIISGKALMELSSSK